MKYIGKKNYSHASVERVGLLVTNLGTPEAPTAPALRKYLAEFLWDPRVVEYPRPLWWLILNLIILRIRPKRSAETYAKIWTKEGSPLMAHTKALVASVKQHFTQQQLEHIEVEFAMRYGQPSISSALHKLHEKNVTKLVVMPLYPQYSGSTTGSTFDAVAKVFEKLRWVPELRFVQHYADDPVYIDACSQQIKNYWASHQQSDKLIFSFHGLPKRFLLSGDPYHCQCHKTARLIADNLGLSDSQWQLTFQSRFGREEWLKPYTDKTLEKLPAEGVTSIDIFCPGFSADCVETLEEIDMLNREIFMDAGGQQFQYIPALNAEPAHIQAVTQLALRNMQGWEQVSSNYDEAKDRQLKMKSQQLAKNTGAEQ
ncbi:MAG: ferrochelatase [Pseudomonadota bacterium]